MQINYKQCTQNDIKKIYELSKNLILTYEDIDHIDLEKVLNWVHKKIELQISEYTQIYDQNHHVGYIHIINDQEIEIDDFYIFDNYQNQGIGTTILNQIITQSNKSIFLYVFINNGKAVSLYKRVGFEIVENIHNSRYIMKIMK